MSLTKRQKDLLKAIINEFISTAEAVGSLTLSDKYDIGVSPATIRSEMSKLVNEGYLFKEHSSSGRMPTTLGIRYFLDEILEEEVIDKLTETEIKERMFQLRFKKNRIIREAIRSLSFLSGLPCLSIIDDAVYIFGIGQLLSHPEFENIELLRDTLDLIESESVLSSIFDKYKENSKIHVLVGDEIGVKALRDCSIVYSPFDFFRAKKGKIAAFGPKRMDYGKVIPAVRIVSNFIEDSIIGWE